MFMACEDKHVDEKPLQQLKFHTVNSPDDALTCQQLIKAQKTVKIMDYGVSDSGLKRLSSVNLGFGT